VGEPDGYQGKKRGATGYKILVHGWRGQERGKVSGMPYGLAEDKGKGKMA